MKNIKIIILILIISGISSSCSVTHYLFLVNNTEKTKQIVIEAYGLDSQIIKYENQIIEINKHTIQKLNKSPNFRYIEENKCELSLPPKSTIYLGMSAKIDGSISKVFLIEEDTIEINDFSTKGLVSPFYTYYEFK